MSKSPHTLERAKSLYANSYDWLFRPDLPYEQRRFARKFMAEVQLPNGNTKNVSILHVPPQGTLDGATLVFVKNYLHQQGFLNQGFDGTGVRHFNSNFNFNAKVPASLTWLFTWATSVGTSILLFYLTK